MPGTARRLPINLNHISAERLAKTILRHGFVVAFVVVYF
jgi:hypothetical protein